MNSCSENSSNFNHTSENSEGLFIIFPILNFAQLILMILLGSLIIYCVFINKTLRDPVSILMASVTAILMLYSIPHLLFSISVLTDLPLLGDCGKLSGHIYIILPVIQWSIETFTVGLIATVQFLTIKYGRKRVTKCKVLPVFAALVILSIVLTVVEDSIDITLRHEFCHVKIRGSLCAVSPTSDSINATATVLEYLIPFTVTMVISYMSHRKIKEMDSDHSVIRSVIMMSVTTILAGFVAKIPLLACVFWATNTGSIVAHLMLTLLIPLDPLCILLLFATTHKTIRGELMKIICNYVKCPTHQQPEVNITLSHQYQGSQAKVKTLLVRHK